MSPHALLIVSFDLNMSVLQSLLVGKVAHGVPYYDGLCKSDVINSTKPQYLIFKDRITVYWNSN